MRRYIHMAATSLLALSASTTLAQAQETEAPSVKAATEAATEDQGSPASDDGIVVTGSRIIRNGYAAPTPVTVVPIQELQQATPSNIPDALNKLPQFASTRGQQSSLTNANAPFAGNYLDLRGAGAVRALILLDGRRVPPTSFDGTVDTNMLPQMLVQRVDIVTAGASAVYGSDAVSGIVNFVLDSKYKGIKGIAQAGISERGDSPSYRLGLAGGLSFGDDRGHLIASVEYFDNDGIARKNDRPGQSNNYLFLGDGTAAFPYRIVSNSNFATVARGGYVASGPVGLRGMQFLPGSVLAPFNPGNFIGTGRSLAYGGDGAAATGTTVLTAGLRTYQGFARLGYEFSDSISGFVQGNYGNSRNTYAALENNFRFGIPIYSGNAYLPADAQAIMTATNTPFITLNRGHDRVDPLTYVDTRNESFGITAGLEGMIGTWHWNAAYTHGESRLKTRRNEGENVKYFAAVDAVDEGQFRTGVRNGNVVCRVTLTNPGLYPGCVPLNVLGEGSGSAAALAYVDGITAFDVLNKMDDFSANVTGDLVELWAGPLSINVGAEYRRQSLRETSNADPAVPIVATGVRTPTPIVSRFVYTNVGVADGSNNVKEIYGEVALPLARNMAFAKALEFNGAVRYTDYSTSGGVTTWKVGLTYQPIDAIRFRGTISRDIRAPNLYELFAGRQFNSTVFNDPRTLTSAVLATFNGGNLNLKPEIGKTKTVGVVIQPMANFSLSGDYYDLKITDAISNVSLTDISNRCQTSDADPLCVRLPRPSPTSFPSSADLSPVNLASLTIRGVDVEASFDTQLNKDLKLQLRGLMSYLIEYRPNTGLSATSPNQAGYNLLGNAYPRVRANINMDLSSETFSFNLLARYFNSTKITNTSVNNNFGGARAPAAVYLDGTVIFHIKDLGGSIDPFITVNNLLDKKPPIIPATGNPGVSFPTTLSLYDVTGRRFTAGVRFRF